MIALLAVGETRHLAHDKAPKDAPRMPFFAQVRHLTGQIGFVLVSGIALVHALTRTGGLFNVVPVLGSLRLNLSVAEIGTGMAVGSVLGLLATYPAGMVADRWGRKAVIVPATLVTAGAFLLFMMADGFLVFAAACVIWGIASSVGGAAPAPMPPTALRGYERVRHRHLPDDRRHRICGRADLAWPDGGPQGAGDGASARRSALAGHRRRLRGVGAGELPGQVERRRRDLGELRPDGVRMGAKLETGRKCGVARDAGWRGDDVHRSDGGIHRNPMQGRVGRTSASITRP